MAENKNITVQQRMLNFATLTRQHMHELPKQEVTSEHQNVQFILPKARLLAQTYIKFDVEMTLKHASATTLNFNTPYAPYKLIRRITEDLNNGFMPVSMSGAETALYNSIATHPDKIIGFNGMKPVEKLTASSTGATNKFSFTLELKNTLNDSMLQGLILLQNNATMVTLNIDVGAIADILEGQTGFTASLTKLTIKPMIVTYTIPAQEVAFPDISVLKLMQSKPYSFESGGDHIINLDVGTIYRKLAFYITDGTGAPIDHESINGTIELAFNGADIPYSISADMLEMLNADQFGRKLPKGFYVFDFSSQSPLIGYGGSRDYVDSEKLTQFTMKINTTDACKVTTICENLSRLI